MHLNNKKTKWVLFLSADGDSELRHVTDLSFGVMCLESNGAKEEDIEVYIDGSNRANIESNFALGTARKYRIMESADFFINLHENTHENIVIFVTGHGGCLGIDAAPTISPHKLLTRLKQTPNLEKAVVFLGQCYAGVFNYIGAGKKKDLEADVIFMGATNLHTSLSLGTTENFLNHQDYPWTANVFLLYVFKWLQNPIDIDGDGRATLMDCYKFAGCMANSLNKSRKRNIFDESIEHRGKYALAVQARIAHDNIPDDKRAPTHDLDLLALELGVKNAEQTYQRSFDLYHTHQECWVLNSIPAQQLELTR